MPDSPNVRRHRVVREVAADHLLQPPPLDRDRLMHALPQRLLDRPQRRSHAIAAALPLELEGAPIRSPVDPLVQILDPTIEVSLVGLPRQPVHAGGGLSPEGEEGRPEQVGRDVVEERGEPFRLPCPCNVRTRSSPWTRFPGPAPGACGPVPRSPRSPPFAPPAPWTVARRCSPASPLLWRGLTSPVRASPATTPRLPGADQTALRPVVGREISRFPCPERACMLGSLTTPDRPGARAGALARVAFRFGNSVGIRNHGTLSR